MSNDLTSPRFSSSGIYSTSVNYSHQNYLSADVSSLREDQDENSQKSNELPELSLLHGRNEVLEFLSSLPAKSWIGKWMYDTVLEEWGYCPTLEVFSRKLWDCLIDGDTCNRELSFQSLGRKTEDPSITTLTDLYRSCWDKCTKVLLESARIVCCRNPAYIRSELYNQGVFIQMCFSESMRNKDLHRMWIRARNLMLYTTARAHRLLTPKKDA